MTAPIETERLRSALLHAGLLVGDQGVLPRTVTQVTDSSQAVTPGAAFVAVKGALRDGHEFLADAATRGMGLAIVEDSRGVTGPALIVSESRLAVAVVGAEACGWPGHELDVVGVTGTSGKTTVVSMLRHLLDAPQARSASIGTLGVLRYSDGYAFPGGSGLTTPGPLELQRLLRASGPSR